jgi:putative phage-type endonuclease
MVKMIELKDREEWLAHRTRIGGSEASAIIGLNPYMSNVDLWKIKTGQMEHEDISEKSFVKYGTEAEQHLRALFELDYPQYQVEYVDNNMWLNDKYPFAHASLDGWLIETSTGRKGIFECKTTNIINSTMKEKWNDRIPDNYYIQLLHYFMVTELEFAELKAQLKWERNNDVFLQTKHYHIERADIENDIQYLIEKESEFWRMVESKQAPSLLLPEL